MVPTWTTISKDEPMSLPSYDVSQSGYSGTYEEERAAKKMLGRLLPRARAEYRVRKPSMGLFQYMGNNGHHYKLRRVVGVHICRSDIGFLADLIFKNLPPGLGTIWGTPSQNPHTTYEGAEAHAVTMLTLTMAAEDGLFTPEKDEGLALFDLEGLHFQYKQDQVAQAAARLNDSDFGALVLGSLSAEGLAEMLREMLKTDFGARTMDEVDFDNELQPERRQFYEHLMLLGLTKGMFRAYRANPKVMPYAERMQALNEGEFDGYQVYEGRDSQKG